MHGGEFFSKVVCVLLLIPFIILGVIACENNGKSVVTLSIVVRSWQSGDSTPAASGSVTVTTNDTLVIDWSLDGVSDVASFTIVVFLPQPEVTFQPLFTLPSAAWAVSDIPPDVTSVNFGELPEGAEENRPPEEFDHRGTYECWIQAVDSQLNPIGMGVGTITVAEGVVPVLPDEASNPSPADSQSGLPTNVDLDWDDAEGAESYDVYFGTIVSPPLVGNVTESFYDPGTLTSGQYYWRIDARNKFGVTEGAVWDFFV